MSAPHPCRETGCSAYALRGGYCQAHKRYAEAARQNAAARGYCQAAWKRTRTLVLALHPMCQHDGCQMPASECDHVIPRHQGGTDAIENLQALCKRHHSMKTAKECGSFGRGIRGRNRHGYN